MTHEVEMTEARITEEMIKYMRTKIGLKLRIEDSIHNEEATRLAILKFAAGVGDANPLWNDPEYAKKTRYATIVAPPSWIISVFAGVQFGWRGLGGFHNATDFEFYKPVRLNDKIIPECTYLGFEGPKPSKFAKEMIIEWFESKYSNQHGEVIAKGKWSIIRVARAVARKKNKYGDIKLPHPWTEDEIKKIEEEILSEEIRGSNPRYWEDVEIGEELKPVVKGPMGFGDTLAYHSGGGTPIPIIGAHGVALRYYQKHPAFGYRDPDTHALEPVFSGHFIQKASKAMGVRMPYNAGFQSFCWQIHLLTNWMSDEGWLKNSYTEYRRFVYHSDVVWLKGKVTKKYLDENGEHCVDIETSAVNQRGENTMPSRATVILPSRMDKASPVARRL